MKILTKQPDRDFVILNLTDTQLSDEEWAEGHRNRRILEHTVRELIRRAQPDLITISGDLAWAGHYHAYEMLADFLESFGIPWAPVWGNHDNQGGAEAVDRVAEKFLTYKHCLYEKGDPLFGNGNYVIAIEEQGVPVEALLMIDSHDRTPYVDENGAEQEAWARLTDPQLEWIGEQLDALVANGCGDATLIMHIPIYAYRKASKAAYKAGIEPRSITFQMADGEDVWNDGYTDSVGVQYEGIGSYVHDEGALEVFKRSGIARRMLCGHDHVNNWKIRYEGMHLMYALNTGAGCYWVPFMNGGTVLKVDGSGVYDVEDVFIDVQHLLEGENAYPQAPVSI